MKHRQTEPARLLILLLGVLGVAVGATPTSLQELAQPKPSFDVASIKPSMKGARQRIAIQSGGRNPVPPPGSVLAGPGAIVGSAVTMDQIVTLLDRLMDRPVIDKTGLAGCFNVSLQFDPQTAPRLAFGARPADESALESPTTGGPSILTAIQEQLGLKLQSRREPVEVLVIDSAQKPTEN
jgi:Protein of unknown function (DUF3738)